VHGHDGVLSPFGIHFTTIEAQLDAENPSLARNVIAAFDAVVLHEKLLFKIKTRLKFKFYSVYQDLFRMFCNVPLACDGGNAI